MPSIPFSDAAYALGVIVAQRQYQVPFALKEAALPAPGVGKAISTPSLKSALPKPTTPKASTAVKAPSVAAPSTDPRTVGLGKTLTVNDLANDTFSAAATRAKVAALASIAARLPAVGAAISSTAKSIAPTVPKVLGGKGMAQAATGAATSTAAGELGRSM